MLVIQGRLEWLHNIKPAELISSAGAPLLVSPERKKKAEMHTLTNRAHFGATLAEASEHIANREPFHTGTLSGAFEDGWDGYVVRSYGVPIAVANVETGISVILDDAYHYSVTTSKHANIAKKAWAL